MLDLFRCIAETLARGYEVHTVDPQCGGQRLVHVGHDVFEPEGGKAGMSQLTCKGFGFEDSKAAPVGAPSG